MVCTSPGEVVEADFSPGGRLGAAPTMAGQKSARKIPICRVVCQVTEWNR